MSKRSTPISLLTPLILMFLNGCGLLLGNIKPVDEKSESYGIVDLSVKYPAEWKKLDPKSIDKNQGGELESGPSSEIADVLYQSKSTSSTISVNSVCRQKAGEKPSLSELSHQVLLGLNPVEFKNEREISLTNAQNAVALETTIKGALNGENVMIRTVVFQKKTCVYDLIYLSAPGAFEKHAPTFTEFVASLKLRE